MTAERIPALEHWTQSASSPEKEKDLFRATTALGEAFARATPEVAARIAEAVFPFLEDLRDKVQWCAICVFLRLTPNQPPRNPGFISVVSQDEAGKVLFANRWVSRGAHFGDTEAANHPGITGSPSPPH
jgi:hypothetical protein